MKHSLSITICLLSIVSCLLSIASCRSEFEIGASVVSIEPADETVSLALAGFALPIEGRFTLGWEEQGAMDTPISNFTGAADKFYGITKQNELIAFERGSLGKAQTIQTNLPVKWLASQGDLLYGINAEGDLYVTQPTGDTFDWKRVASVGEIKAFTSSGKKLYAATHEGDLLEGIADRATVSWKTVAHVGAVRSLASDGNRLYALGDDSVLYQCELHNPQESRMRIGYKNGETYLIDIDRIACSGGKLYALTYDNKLYTNKHNSEGNMSARAVSFKKGKEIAVVVSVDVCGFDHSFIQDIKDEIYRKRGIPGDAILINASHSHYTPVTQSWITWEKQNQHPDTLYLNNTVRRGIIRSIEEALDNAVESQLFFGRDTTSIGKNRRNLDVYDNIIDVVQAVSKKDNKKTVLFLTACHPVSADPHVSRFTASANFPGYAKQWIEATPDVETSLFLQGCAGDINPNGQPFRTSGERLAQGVIAVLNAEMAPVRGTISYSLDTIAIPVTPWSREQIHEFMLQAQEKPADLIARRNVRWAKLMLDQYEQNGTPATEMPVYVQTLNIGDWKLVGLSREATSEFALAIRNLWPDRHVSVAGYTNDVSSYLATDPYIKAKTYDGYDSFFWYGQPAHFPLQTFDAVVNKIKENNR
jgi:hypothetical protein